MQGKWDEMFGVKEEVAEEVKVKKPRRKTKRPIEKKVTAKKLVAKRSTLKIGTKATKKNEK